MTERRIKQYRELKVKGEKGNCGRKAKRKVFPRKVPPVKGMRGPPAGDKDKIKGRMDDDWGTKGR